MGGFCGHRITAGSARAARSLPFAWWSWCRLLHIVLGLGVFLGKSPWLDDFISNGCDDGGRVQSSVPLQRVHVFFKASRDHSIRFHPYLCEGQGTVCAATE